MFCRSVMLSFLNGVIETVEVTEGCKYVLRGSHLFQSWYRTLEGPIYDKGLLKIYQAIYLFKTK